MVLGVSPGVGKSTFARKLGELLDSDVYHLDAYFWKPNWVEASFEEFSANQKEIVKSDKWIIEGNYSNTYDIRVEKADTIIYLELPLFVCLYRVVKRRIVNHGKTRPDIGIGCKEKLDRGFLTFICTTYYSRKKKMGDRLQAFKNSGAQKQTIILKSKKEIQAYLDKLAAELVE
jgi:adenylate kinase family enzyme